MKAKKGSNKTSPAKKKATGEHGFREMKTGDGTVIKAPIAAPLPLGELVHAKPGPLKKLNGKANGSNGHAKNGIASFADDPELKEKLEAAGATLAEALDPFENDKPVKPPPLPPRTRELPCRLTDDEVIAVGAQLANTHEQIDDLDTKIDSLKEQQSLLKKEREVLDANASGQARAVRSRRTFRQVECKEVEGVELSPLDPSRPRDGVLTIRLDTNEPFEWRQFRSDEKQGSLWDEGETQFAGGAP